MIRIRVLLILTLSFCILNSSAQNIEDIKNDSSIIWAEGVGASIQEADKMALAEISQQISVEVLAITSRISTNTGKDHSVEQRSEISTNSSASFNNIEMRILSEQPQYRVIRWIRKDEISRQHNERTTKLKEMVRIANTALSAKQISDAIRYYYWAYSLLSTLPQQRTVTIEDETGNEQLANIWIPNQIKSILKKIECNIVRESSDAPNDYEVLFSYDGKPLVNVDYSYFDGTDWSPVCTATDGKSIIELRASYKPKNLMIRYEYKFLGEARSDKEVEKIISMGAPSFDTYCTSSASFSNLQNNESYSALQTKGTNTCKTPSNLSKDISSIDITSYDKIMREIIRAIRQKDFLSVTSFFSVSGNDCFTRLINYGKAKIIGDVPTLNYSLIGEDIVCRSIPMNFTFSGNRKFSEDVVFTFNKEGLIDNISFGLGKVAHDNILGHLNNLTQEKCDIISNFLENFKTAYALKRLDYIEQLFDDDAIIITGKVLQKFNGNKEFGLSNNRYVQLVQQDKATYMRHLKRSFASKEFINIKFANNRIRRTKVDGVYAIQIKQDYFSSNYGDSGYLFLLVDIRNTKEPIIHVRAWQEQPDPEWGILGPEFF